MVWAMIAVGGGFLGLAVLGVLAIRVFVAAEQLGRQVAEAARRVNRAAEALEEAAKDAASAAGAGGANLR